jgi:hypothetical protein
LQGAQPDQTPAQGFTGTDCFSGFLLRNEAPSMTGMTAALL